MQAHNNIEDSNHNTNADGVVAAMMTEVERQTAAEVREQSDVILALTRNSNATASTVNHRISASSSRTMDVSDGEREAEAEANGCLSLIDDDVEEDDIDEARLMESLEVAKQRAPMIRQQSDMILLLTSTADDNVNSDMLSIANTDDADDDEAVDGEYTDGEDDGQELQIATGTTSSIPVQDNEEGALKTLIRKNRTKIGEDQSPSTSDTSGLSSSTSTTDEGNPSLPGACRVIRSNQGEGGSSFVLSPTWSVQRLQPPPPPQYSPQQQPQDNDDNDNHSTSSSSSSHQEDSSGRHHIHHEVEAQAVDDVTIVAQIITRDELMSEVRDQVLAEAGMTNNDATSNTNNNKDEEIKQNKKEMAPPQRQSRKQRTLLAILLGGCLLIVITIGLVFGLGGGDDSSKNADNNNSSSSPQTIPLAAPTAAPSSMTEITTMSMSPTTPRTPEEVAFIQLRERMVPLLFTYAGVDEAETANHKLERAGPIRRSFIHLSLDPSWMDYSDRRLVRRWVLGVLYYSTTQLTTGRHDWINLENWLDYEVHECRWYGVVTPTLNNGDDDCETLPDDAGIGLHLPNNNLRNKVPTELVFLADTLVSIDFSGNFIAVFHTKLFGAFPNLESLILRDNIIEGELIVSNTILCEEEQEADDGCSLFEDSVLTELDLGNNLYLGELPVSLSRLQHLEVLRVDGNVDMTGTIPTAYCDMVQLQELTVFNTTIVGEMPTCFCDRAANDSNNNNNFLAEADCSRGDFSCDCCEGFGCGAGG